MKVMVTGASGFVGSRFMEYSKIRYQLLPASLRSGNPLPDLSGLDVIVHLAGKANDMKLQDDSVYFKVNYDLTKELADKAKREGVQHFIYVSTVKVYGDETEAVLNENSACYPADAYGKSKLQAEDYVRSLQTGNFKIAIIRPPLVYGPGVKGNMIRFLKLAATNLPLPFANSRNERSMVFVDNLAELINRIIDRSASGTFIAGDEKPISTEALITMMRASMYRKPRLIDLPFFIRALLKKIKPSLFKRLYGSFVIDNSQTNRILNFKPPYSTEDGIRRMVEWYLTPAAVEDPVGGLKSDKHNE